MASAIRKGASIAMRLLQLEYFCAIAECENMGRAADNLNVAQSAMSKSLSSLEKELGVQLFDRVGKYLQLNDNGRLFYQQVRYALTLIDDAAGRLRNPVTRMDGEVVVCVDSLIPYFSDLLLQFHAEYPRIQLKAGISEDGRRLRERGTYDIAISDYLLEKREVQDAVILKDEFILLLPAAHALAGSPSVDLADLRDDSFIYCCRVDDQLSQRYDAMCAMAGFTPRIFLTGADLDIATTLVRAGQGVSILPGSAIAALSPQMREGIALADIRSPYCAQPIYALSPVGKVKSPSAQVFQDFLQRYFKRMYPDGVCGLTHPINAPPPPTR